MDSKRDDQVGLDDDTAIPQPNSAKTRSMFARTIDYIANPTDEQRRFLHAKVQSLIDILKVTRWSEVPKMRVDFIEKLTELTARLPFVDKNLVTFFSPTQSDIINLLPHSDLPNQQGEDSLPENVVKNLQEIEEHLRRFFILPVDVPEEPTES